MKDIYDKLQEKLTKLTGGVSDNPNALKLISLRLRLKANEQLKETLQVVFNETDPSILADKVLKQREYYEKSKTNNYIVGSQPKSQKRYWDKEASVGESKAKNRWKKLASLARQSTTTLTVSKDELKDMSGLYTKFSDPNKSLVDKKRLYNSKIFRPLSNQLEITMTNNQFTEVTDLLSNQWIQGETSLDSKIIAKFPKNIQTFIAQCNNLFSLTKNIHTLNNNTSTNTADIKLLPIEYKLLNDVLLPTFEFRSLNARLLEKQGQDTKEESSITAFPMTLHGHSVDSIVKIATSEESTRLFVKEGTLYQLNPQTLSRELASTQSMTFKDHKEAAGLIIDMDGGINIFKHEFGEESGDKKFHSLVTGGTSVLFAGSIKIDDGKITEISDNSGHYQPEHYMEFFMVLSEKGLLHDKIRLDTLDSKARIIYKLEEAMTSTSGKKYIFDYVKNNGANAFSDIEKLIHQSSSITTKANQLIETVRKNLENSQKEHPSPNNKTASEKYPTKDQSTDSEAKKNNSPPPNKEAAQFNPFGGVQKAAREAAARSNNGSPPSPNKKATQFNPFGGAQKAAREAAARANNGSPPSPKKKAVQFNPFGGAQKAAREAEKTAKAKVEDTHKTIITPDTNNNAPRRGPQ